MVDQVCTQVCILDSAKVNAKVASFAKVEICCLKIWIIAVMVPATFSIQAAGPISPYAPIRHTFSKQPLGGIPTHAKPTTARSLGQAPFRSSRNACRSSRTKATQIRAGFLSLFRPNKQTATDTAELVNELLDTASRTDGGAKASQDQRTKIRELVSSE